MKIQNLAAALLAVVAALSLAACSEEQVESAKTSVQGAAESVAETAGEPVDAAGLSLHRRVDGPGRGRHGAGRDLCCRRGWGCSGTDY